MSQCEGITKKGDRCSRKKVVGDYCTQHSKSLIAEEAGGETITITFGDVCENHVGMQQIGSLKEAGFTIEELEKIQKKFEKKSCKCELVSLNPLVDAETDPAGILIIRNAISLFTETEELFEELKGLEWDTKALMYGRVINKKARYNLCFADEAQEADYEEGKGTVIAFSDVPNLNLIREKLPKYLGEKGRDLTAEGNFYYDVKKTYISNHGDSERRIVVALRLGSTFSLHYQWFLKGEAIGERIDLSLDNGDMYIMSAKAVGHDWKKKNIPTLRHSAGDLKLMK